MFTIYPDYLLNQTASNPTVAYGQEKRQTPEYLAIAQLFARNAQMAVKAFNDKDMRKFDPLVRDRNCQVHAIHLLELFQDPEVQREMTALIPALKKVLRSINETGNKPPIFSQPTSIKIALEKSALIVSVSAKVQLLFFAHLLTFCSINREPYYIDYGQLRDKTSRSLSMPTIKELVSRVREIFSESSIQFIQSKVRKLSSAEGRKLVPILDVVKKFPIKGDRINEDPNLTLNLSTTCMFYNMKAILCMAKEAGLLLLLKEVKKTQDPAIGAFFRASSSNGPFVQVLEKDLRPDEYVVVFEGKVPKDSNGNTVASYVAQESLENIILEEITHIEQFVVDNDLSSPKPDDQDEIKHYKARAQIPRERGFDQIEHVYLSSVKTENIL